MSSLLRQEDVDQHMYCQAFAQHDSGIRLLPGSVVTIQAEAIDNDPYCRLLDFAKANSHPTVVCFDDLYERNRIPLLMPLDHLLVPTRGDVASIWRTKQRTDWLAMNGFDAAKILVVMFDDGTDAHADTDDVSRVLGLQNVRRVPLDFTENAISLNLGQPLAVRCPQSSTTKAIQSCRDFLMGKGDESDLTDSKSFMHVRAAAAVLLSAFARPY